jgi:serine protease
LSVWAFGRVWPLLVLSLALLLTQGGSYGETPRLAVARPQAAPGEILVQFDRNFAPTGRRVALDRIGARFRRRGYLNTFEVVSVPAGQSFDAALARLRRTPGVKIAEPNYYVYASATVNDPFFRPYQWNLADTGYGIHAETAWNTSVGSGVTVAVVDTGVAYENYGTLKAAPDLAGTTFVPGFDFVDYDTHPQDENGHGTHVTGTLAQTTNNGIGCAGVAFGAKIMPVRVLDKDGSGTMDQVASGIRWAADNGAKVINLSLGGPSGSAALLSAVQYAASKDVVVVAAAGNKSSAMLEYPAFYPETIAVGATRFDGQLAAYSNYGPDVDVVAPGGDLKVDQNHDGYPDGILQQMPVPGAVTTFNLYFMQGTSMATPHVAGIAALVRSRHPEWSAALVRDAIEKTCRDLGLPGKDGTYGYGLVDAAAAVQYAPPDTTAPTPPNTLKVTDATPDTVSLTWNASTDNVGVAGYRLYRNAQPAVSLSATTFVDTGRAAGTTYQYYVVAYDAAGNVSGASNSVTATTQPIVIPQDTTPPSTPRDLSTIALTPGSVSLTWSASTDDTGVARYDISRNGVVVGSSTGTTYTDSTVEPATDYAYTVVAIDPSHNPSSPSSVLFVNTPSPAPPPDNGIFSFEDGTLQGWRSLNSHAVLSNTTAIAYTGQRALRVGLGAVSLRSKAALTATIPGGTPAPVGGQTIRLRMFEPSNARLQARAVAYDARSNPLYGQWVALTPNGWREFTVEVPGYAAGAVQKIDIQLGTSSGVFTGDAFLDAVTW